MQVLSNCQIVIMRLIEGLPVAKNMPFLPAKNMLFLPAQSMHSRWPCAGAYIYTNKVGKA